MDVFLRLARTTTPPDHTIGDRHDVIKWWVAHRERLPRLFPTAIRVVLVSASSSSAERAGSFMHEVINDHTTSLSIPVAELRSFLVGNSELMNRCLLEHFARLVNQPFGILQASFPSLLR